MTGETQQQQQQDTTQQQKELTPGQLAAMARRDRIGYNLAVKANAYIVSQYTERKD